MVSKPFFNCLSGQPKLKPHWSEPVVFCWSNWSNWGWSARGSYTPPVNTQCAVWLRHSGRDLCVQHYCGGLLPCSLCCYCAPGQRQLSKTQGKQPIQACWQFVVEWSFACDLVVYLMCLDTVGLLCMWAMAQIIMRWLALTHSATFHCHKVQPWSNRKGLLDGFKTVLP